MTNLTFKQIKYFTQGQNTSSQINFNEVVSIFFYAFLFCLLKFPTLGNIFNIPVITIQHHMKSDFQNDPLFLIETIN